MKRLTLLSILSLNIMPLSHATADIHYMVTCSGSAARVLAVFTRDFQNCALNLQTSDFTFANVEMRIQKPSEGFFISLEGQAEPNHSVTASFPRDVYNENVTYKGQFLVTDLTSHQTTTTDVDCKSEIC